MNKFKKTMAALRSAVLPKKFGGQQSGGRSMQGNTLNYNSVTTLDPARLAAAFTSADQGFISEQAKLFELVEERDPHIYAELNKRRLAVTGLKWQLEPPRDASQAEIDTTNELADIIRSIGNIEDTQFDMTDAIGKGVVALELNWRAGHIFMPTSIDFVPQRNFQTDPDSGNLLYIRGGIPEPLIDGRWMVHEHRAKSGYIEQSALFRVLAWTYSYKAYNTKDMMRFLEVYGLPLRLGKYPAGIGDKQRDELLRAVRSIGNDGAGVVPSNMMIDFIQAQAGKVDDFLNAAAYWESKQSKAILGGELDGKTTSEARIVLYDKVRKQIMQHDVKQLEPGYSNGLVKPIALLNGMFAADRLPKWRYITEEPADRKALIDVLASAANVGFKIDVEWAQAEMQIPMAKEGADILGGNAAKAMPAALKAALSRAPLKGRPTIADAYSQQLTDVMMPFGQEALDKIAALVSEAGDFEGALAALTAFNLEKPSSGLINALAEGMAAANLAGRVEAKDGRQH